ncbi:MAG: STY4851/ECs_5259 family protein [Candidatus Competibacter sp.]
MNMMNWLTKFLFAHSRQTVPDSRPLYAYKMRDATYANLRDHFHQILLWDSNGELASRFPPIFCLYAAETFRREHAEGSWTWETVFRPLGVDAPSHQQIADWVEKGLKWWRRPLLRGKDGSRRFLVTIACEGGLPLRLLQRENTHLTQFFRTVLESYYRAGQGGEAIAETIALQQAHRLPRSLRHEPVFHLAATLIAKIGELQSRIGDSTDPIATLDQKAPDWRRDLPLRLEDQVAETLLTGLVRRFGELVRETGAWPRWRGRLRETRAGWQVEKRLELPECPSGAQLAEWINSPAAERPRWRLLLHTPAGTEVMAWLTRVQGEGKSARYRREWLRHGGGVVLTGAAVGQPHRLTLHDGQQEYDLTVRDGEPWGDSPWVFVERGAGGERDWLTEGSARTRLEQAWVLAAPELIPREVAGVCEDLGTIAELHRVVYRISGEIELLTLQQDRYRIVCRAESESEETFVVFGHEVTRALQQRSLYCGLPQIQALDREGRRQPTAGRVQWRPVGDSAPWREIHEAGHGQIWLRLIDAVGAERCRRQVDVVPRNFRIEIDIGTGNQAGVVRLIGLAGAEVRLGPDSPTGVSVNLAGDRARIVCSSLPGALPPPLTFLLNWPGSQPIALELPYPHRGAFFQLAGQSLPNDDWIPLGRLGGLRLFIQDPASGRHFWLEGELIARPDEAVERFRQRFHERLPLLEQGRIEVSLLPWQDRIASLLASTQTLDAQVRLIVETVQGERLAKIRISRFDAMIEPDRAASLVRIPDDSLARLGSKWEGRVQLEMLRLWAPDDPAVPLPASPNHAACWEVPADLQPGPWWIVGRDGDWTRFRPLLWVATTNETPVEDAYGALAGTIREPDSGQREQKLSAVLAELGQNPDHPDWPLLLDYVRLTREFPPSSLDILRRLPAHSRTLALALFKADDETFEPAWSLSRQMPFLWVLLAVNAWREAATAYFGGLQATLAEMEGGAEMVFGWFQNFRKRADTRTRRPYWGPLCDWLQERVFLGQKLGNNSELNMARRCPSIIEQQIESLEQELQGRHDSGEKWPESIEIMGWRRDIAPKYRYAHLDPFYQPVRCAPFVVAHLSLNDIAPGERLIDELRLLRAFDREWFDKVHARTLALGLARRPLEA